MAWIVSSALRLVARGRRYFAARLTVLLLVLEVEKDLVSPVNEHYSILVKDSCHSTGAKRLRL